MRYLIEDTQNERLIIAFDNSSGELEYDMYEKYDGGTTSLISTNQDTHRSFADDMEDSVQALLTEFRIPDAEIQEIEE